MLIFLAGVTAEAVTLFPASDLALAVQSVFGVAALLVVLFTLAVAIGETVTVMLLSLSCLLSRYCHATVIYCHLLPLLLLW